jgi:hypothetical protein
MGTRRHRRRYRGGEEFVPKPFVAPKPNPNSRRPVNIEGAKKMHEEAEKKRYEEWKAKREVEARQDLKGHEENRMMAPFYEKKKNELSQELIDTAKHREEADIESTRDADEKKRRSECKNHLRSHVPPLKNTATAQSWLQDKSNQKKDPYDYKEVRDCVRILNAPTGGRRKTRRRKSHRRR